ncbi:MAG: hypothetical protein P8N76_11390 [Pirellulaceae bacterium]|nr:hypothetical protein [Pirellulaceae bacterium]
MRLIHPVVSVAALFLCTPEVLADDSFRPLDTRTRCIVLFRECLVLIDKKDVNGIFEIIADGGPSDSFKLYPDPDSLSPKLKQELQDVDRFFSRNFRNASLIKRTFNTIQYSELVTAKEFVSVTDTVNNKKAEARLHSIKIRVPDTDRHEVGELRFVEIANNIYWIPFGW